MVDIQVKRVYEPYDPNDGYRVLVDRLWPRGLTKERVHYDLWEKVVAPSNELRRAFGHKPENWPAFRKAYLAELDADPAAAAFADELAKGAHSKVTLLYGAKNTAMNQAVVLKQWLEGRLAGPKAAGSGA